MSLSRNQWIAIAAGVVVLLLGAAMLYVASPQRALTSIHEQVEAGEGLGETMPLTQRELQALLFQRTRAQMQKDLAQGESDSKFLLLGPAMAEILADREAWELSDPANFKRLLLDSQGRSIYRGGQGSYRGGFRYVAHPHDPLMPSIVLHRKGLGWEIESFEYPVEQAGSQGY